MEHIAEAEQWEGWREEVEEGLETGSQCGAEGSGSQGGAGDHHGRADRPLGHQGATETESTEFIDCLTGRNCELREFKDGIKDGLHLRMSCCVAAALGGAGEVCVGQTHKMVVASTGGVADGVRTSKTTGLLTTRLRRTGTIGLRSAETTELGTSSNIFTAARADIIGGSATLDASTQHLETAFVELWTLSQGPRWLRPLRARSGHDMRRLWGGSGFVL